MAILKSRQVREMNLEDLNKRLSELKLELLKEQGNAKMGRPIKNSGKIGELKRAIARIHTVQQERKLKLMEKRNG